MAQEAVGDINKTVEQFGGDTSWVSAMLEHVTEAMEKIDNVHNITAEKTYIGYQTAMFQLCRNIAKHSQDLVKHPGVFVLCHIILVV